MIARRGFVLAALAAPALVRSGLVMPIKPLPAVRMETGFNDRMVSIYVDGECKARMTALAFFEMFGRSPIAPIYETGSDGFVRAFDGRLHRALTEMAGPGARGVGILVT